MPFFGGLSIEEKTAEPRGLTFDSGSETGLPRRHGCIGNVKREPRHDTRRAPGGKPLRQVLKPLIAAFAPDLDEACVGGRSFARKWNRSLWRIEGVPDAPLMTMGSARKDSDSGDDGGPNSRTIPHRRCHR